MIAVTCRNGEHFSVDPAAIERVETDPDTVVHLVDGTKYVVDELLRRAAADHLRPPRATLVVAPAASAGGVAEIADAAGPAMRIERRARSRDGDAPGDPRGRPPRAPPRPTRTDR